MHESGAVLQCCIPGMGAYLAWQILGFVFEVNNGLIAATSTHFEGA